jgi:hypothetical protein
VARQPQSYGLASITPAASISGAELLTILGAGLIENYAGLNFTNVCPGMTSSK